MQYPKKAGVVHGVTIATAKEDMLAGLQAAPQLMHPLSLERPLVNKRKQPAHRLAHPTHVRPPTERSGSAPPAIPPSVAGSSSIGGDALPISPDPTLTRATYSTVVPARSRHMSPRRRSRSTTGSAHSSADESDSGAAHPQEMEVEGTQGGEEVLRDPSVDLLLGQYTLKFRDTVEDLPGDLEVLTTSIAKATDWVLRATHHNPLTIDGGDAFVAQMTSFVNAVMATNFSRIRRPGELDNFSLASLLEAETSSKDEPTIHPAPVFRPPPPAARGPLDEGVAGVGAPPDVLMQALDDLSRLASPSRIPASKKCKGVDRPVPPPPQKKSKPKPRPMTWAGITRQAAPMPPLPPGLGPQRCGPSPLPPTFPTGRMKTSPHRSVPSFTSEGPTRKQVLVSFGGTPPDLTKFFTESAGWSIYDGLSLVTPAVASPSDLDILRNFIHESLPTGTPFEVALPLSTSFIKILDVPYFDPKGLKITQEALEKALHTSVHAEVFAYLSTKPRIDRNSAHSTLCMVYCNIWDSQQGTHAKKALGQLIFLAGRSCAIRPAHARCCKGNAKAKPPVPPTPHDQPCPHNGRCVNCHKDHAANSASCKYWAHRYDREWIMNKYRQTNVGKPTGSK
ncbi:unnamed protein product [Cyclocybe aegerita]|uniref:Uncharacterized protein n=1 Tax=Cyclocybe aegerita TaxID=1973307 RepID=A0A8S0VRE9_CYCAE|nr:unnamed protein product [Cyclocybe aegerita]